MKVAEYIQFALRESEGLNWLFYQGWESRIEKSLFSLVQSPSGGLNYGWGFALGVRSKA